MSGRKVYHIKKTLILYNIIMLVIMLAAILIANLSTRYSLETYDDYSEKYEQLNSFYEHINEMDTAAKSYLYNKSTETEAFYDKEWNAALLVLNNLEENTDNEEIQWKYAKLGKMLQTYDEFFHMINERETPGEMTVSETYEFFNSIPDNIERSYQQCSIMLAQEMKRANIVLQEKWQKQMVWSILTVGILICGVVVFAVGATKSITKPLDRIVKNVENIKEGNYQFGNIKSKYIEVQVLDRAVKQMAQGVWQNILHMEEKADLEKELLEKENANLEMNRLLVQSELQMLQQQINPHFLFNTLSLISKMAYLEGAEKTNHLMEITSDLLRYSLDKASGASNLYEEIECVKNYLEIQKQRFGERIFFDISIEESLPNITVPGMIIQPLIENSVQHGVKDLMEQAYIRVSFTKRQQNILIQVEDNGCGMEEEIIICLLNGKENISKEKSRKSIGVWNVCKRLEMFYGRKGLMRIESNPGCGTIVSLFIPVEMEGENV